MTGQAVAAPREAAADPGPPRPRRSWIWIVIAILTICLIAGGAGFRMWLKLAHQTLTSSMTITHQVTAVDISAPGSAIGISPGQAGHVSIGRTLTWVFQRPQIRRHWQGSVLYISARCPGRNLFGDCSADLQLRVPAGVAVLVNVGSGSVAASGLTGSLRLTATSGSIAATDCIGPLWAAATSGSISAPGLAAPTLHAAVTSGSISAAFVSPPRRISLQVGSGHAAVSVPPRQSYQIRKQQGTGTLAVGAGLADSASSRVAVLNVGSGTIALDYPLGTAPVKKV